MTPERSEIWWVDFDPTAGHEQARKRPALVVSADTFNRGPQELVVVVPLTRTIRPLPLHVPYEPKDCGPNTTLQDPGVIMCDQVRTVSLHRFLDSKPVGRISPRIMAMVETRLRALLVLPENA